MGRGKKLERTLWTGLAVTAFAAGIAAGPKINNTVKKFGKWFEKPKIEMIEQKENPASALKAKKPKVKAGKKTKEKEKEIEKIMDIKTNKELSESVPHLYKSEAEKMLRHFDSAGLDKQEKEKFIKLYSSFIESRTGRDSYEEILIFTGAVINTPDQYPDSEFIEKYIKTLDKLLIINNQEEGFGYSFLLLELENVAKNGKLNTEAIETINKTIDNAKYKKYAYECMTKFLAATDILNSYSMKNFAQLFAQITDRITDQHGQESAFSVSFKESLKNPENNQYMINENYVSRLEDLYAHVRKNESYNKNKSMECVLTTIIGNPGSKYFSTGDVIAGENMAESLGLYSFEIGLNFGFAINAIGEEKTRQLYEEYGIVYFGRYNKNILEELYNTLDKDYKKDKPVLLAVYNKNDWNGFFYDEQEKYESLGKPYKMLIYEVDDEHGFTNAMLQTYGNHGKIDVLLIGGHGEPGGISLGKGWKESNQIDVNDKNELNYLKNLFSDEPKIILDSCSTGKNINSIGAVLSDIFDATVWAPVNPSGEIKLLFNEDGELEEVEHYDSAYRKFVDGKIVSTEMSIDEKRDITFQKIKDDIENNKRK